MVCVGCTSLYDDFADSLCCSLLFYQSILSLCDILYFWTFSICIWTWELQMWTAFPMSTCMAEHRCALFEVIKCSGIPFVKHLPVGSRGSGFSICIGPKCAKPSPHLTCDVLSVSLWVCWSFTWTHLSELKQLHWVSVQSQNLIVPSSNLIWDKEDCQKTWHSTSLSRIFMLNYICFL